MAPKVIEEALEREFGGKGYAIPKPRTIFNLCKDVPVRSSGDAWTLSPDTLEPERVLGVLAEVIRRTDGAVSFLTRDEAKYIGLVYRAAPDVPPWEAYVMAGDLARSGDTWDAAALTHWLLAFRPWRDGFERYAAAMELPAFRASVEKWTESTMRYETLDDLPQGRGKFEQGDEK